MNSGKVKLATIWLDGCSGCHMSFLDIDERLIVIAEKVDLLYSPLVDTKEFPDWVDVTLVEGAVSSDEDLEKIRHIRAHTKTLVALGDCAVTGNVPAMRDLFTLEQVIKRSYYENATENLQTPSKIIPKLLPKVKPVHEVVHVDVFVPGCPPSADRIFQVLTDLVEGRMPDLAMTATFGA